MACAEPEVPHFSFSGPTMGTRYHITVLQQGDSATNQQELQQAIDQQLQLINQQMSTYIDDSELMRLNRAAVGEWVPVSANLFEVLMLSLELGWLSNGAFDITVGPLVKLWGFGPGTLEMPDAVPSESSIQSELQSLGFQNIEFDLENNQIRKKQAVSIDLSAIAKGYAADKVAELLNYAGYRDFMVEIGGELHLQGHSPRGLPWRIAIEEPVEGRLGEVHQALVLTDVGMATSGDYRNYFEQEGIRYSHTIDPATGYPIKHKLASVTVVAESAAYADGLATALNVLGPEKGLKLAESQGLAVYMMVKTEQGFESRYSNAFKVYLE